MAKALLTVCCAVRARPGSRRCLPRSRDSGDLTDIPGAVTAAGGGPAPGFVHSLDTLLPARDLLRHRKKYFLGVLDPCASIEFSRGCPWDCSFCSAWTFYGRVLPTLVSPERVIEDLRAIREPGVFIVDDVAFIHERHGFELGEAVARAGSGKTTTLKPAATCCCAIRTYSVSGRRSASRICFSGSRRWTRRGPGEIPKARAARAQFRSAGIRPLARHPPCDQSDRRSRIGTASRFRVLREWCLEQPEIINISVNTPYPGTESWLTEERRLQTRDYRLFDIQHAVLPTRMPLAEFYEELIGIQRAIYAKHLDWRSAWDVLGLATRLLLRGQTNFVKSLFKLNGVYRPELLLADHARPVAYEIPLPPQAPDTRVGRAGRGSMCMRHAAAPGGRSTPRRRPLSMRREWARHPKPLPTGTTGSLWRRLRGRAAVPRFPDKTAGEIYEQSSRSGRRRRSVARHAGSAGRRRRARAVPGIAPPGPSGSPELSERQTAGREQLYPGRRDRQTAARGGRGHQDRANPYRSDHGGGFRFRLAKEE